MLCHSTFAVVFAPKTASLAPSLIQKRHTDVIESETHTYKSSLSPGLKWIWNIPNPYSRALSGDSSERGKKNDRNFIFVQGFGMC